MPEEISSFEKNGKKYSVVKGLTDAQIDEIIHYAQTDDLVVKQTSDAKRFKDRAAFNNYLLKNPIFYGLLDSDQNLVGVMWFREKHMPSNADEYKVVFAIRTYAHGRGAGLAKPFMQLVFEHFKESEEFKRIGSKGIWLETQAENKVAKHLYSDIGFKQLGPPDSSGIIIMVS